VWDVSFQIESGDVGEYPADDRIAQRAAVKGADEPLAIAATVDIADAGAHVVTEDMSGSATREGSAAPWTLTISTLRKQAMGVFTQPPTGTSPQSPLLSGPFV